MTHSPYSINMRIPQILLFPFFLLVVISCGSDDTPKDDVPTNLVYNGDVYLDAGFKLLEFQEDGYTEINGSLTIEDGLNRIDDL